jgi:hypothetical protein
MPGPPGGSRGGPALEQAAQDSIAAVRQQRPLVVPPEYAPAALTDEDKTEAAKDQAAVVCGLCAGYHHMPSTAACPRLASFELDGDGKLKSGTFWPGKKWADGRVVFYEDTKEEGDPGGS